MNGFNFVVVAVSVRLVRWYHRDNLYPGMCALLENKVRQLCHSNYLIWTLSVWTWRQK